MTQLKTVRTTSTVFDSIMSIVVPNFDQIGRFLYFGGHFRFKMAAIANRNGRNMVQHVLLPVALRYSNQYLVMNLFLSWIKLKYCSLDSNQYCVKNWIFNDFLNFNIGGHFENFKNRAQLWVMIYFCVKFQKENLVSK
jgi:hypothetical protein